MIIFYNKKYTIINRGKTYMYEYIDVKDIKINLH